MDELRKMQLMLTDILKVFHDFCELHSLRYYAAYGTLLGAARHNGFIPWDDDIDVVMPRPDYEKLKEIFNKTNNDGRYVLESPYSTDDYFFSFCKIFDTQTTLIENVRNPVKRGIYLDIFPLDGINEYRTKDRINLLFISFFKKWENYLLLRISKPKYKVVLFDCFFAASRFVHISENKLARIIDSLCQKNNYETSDKVANLMGLVGKKEIVPKSFFGTPTICQFEDIHIHCPNKTDEYLSHIYGDWRTPPPIEKQVTHHDYYLNLNKPYLD